MEPLSSFKLLS